MNIKTGKRYFCLLLILALVLSSGTYAMGADGASAAELYQDNEIFRTLGHFTLDELTELFGEEISGDAMLLYAALVYQGWRTSSGHWLDAVMVDLHDKFVGMGFKDGERTTANNQGDSVWYQYDGTVTTWNPQYLSVKVAAGVDAADPRVKTIEFIADCIDPTSMYFPDYVTPEYLISGLDDPGSAAYAKQYSVNKRCHMPTNGTFFAYTDPNKTPAENIAAGTKTGKVIYVGTVTASSNSLGIPASQLAGNIILTTSTAATAVRTYCTSVGAIAALCRVSEGARYQMPVINGVRWYTDYVPYTSGAGWAAPGANVPVVLHYSLDEYAALSSLIAQGDISLSISALGTYEAGQPRRCLVAEIQGATKPQERIYVPSHINEPGACDNASGVAMNFEIVSTLKRLIDSGEIKRPERTMTFVWGDEITMTNNWEAKYRNEFLNVKGSIDLDMTGEDPAKTGGNMLIEKTPDPSDIATTAIDTTLRYRYGNFTFPGQTGLPLAYSVFIREPDKFSLWTGGTSTNITPSNNYPGFFLNDLYLQTALDVQKTNPNFNVDSNPYEGGSDHSPFVENALSRVGAFIPALLTWHFTDYVYHSSCDTLDKLSVQELHDVGTVSASVAYMMANAFELEAADTIEQVVKSWATRLGYEKANTLRHYNWMLSNPTNSQAASSYNRELKAIGDWSRWYIEAVRSAGRFMVGGTLGTPYKLSAALQAKEDAAVAAIQADTLAALEYVDSVFGRDSAQRPKQIASAYVKVPAYVQTGGYTNLAGLVSAARLPARITVEYVGGGTGEANVAWSASSPAYNTTRVGLSRITGTLSGLETGVVNWAIVQGVAEINTYNAAVKPGVFFDSYKIPAYIGDIIKLEPIAESYDGGTLSFEWYNAAGALIGTERALIIPASSTGSFEYYVTVTNTNNAVPGVKTASATSAVVTVNVVGEHQVNAAYSLGKTLLLQIFNDDGALVAKLSNTSGQNVVGNVILAVYEKASGKMIACESAAFQANNLTAWTNEFAISAVQYPSSNYDYKAFCWDTSFVPLTNLIDVSW